MLSHSTTAAIRYGYGLRQGDPEPQDADAMMKQLTDAAQKAPFFPLEGVEARRQTVADYFALRKTIEEKKKAGFADGEVDKALNKDVANRFNADVSARIAQATLSPFGFHERLATFWLNHFTVSADKSTENRLLVPLFEAEAIRPHLGGHFATLLKEVSLHPAMIVFLDQAQSIGPNSKAGLKRKDGGSNENFAREVMELHTLGAGTGYTQADVRQLSLLLTGITFDRIAVSAGYDVNRAEPGSFNVLGKTYTRSVEPFLNAVAVLEDLAKDERTMRHVSRQLYAHFIAETVDDSAINAMVAAWKQGDGYLPDVYRAMLQSRGAWDQPGQKYKLPFDYVVSTLRAVGVTKDDIMGEDAKPLGRIVMPVVDMAQSKSNESPMMQPQMADASKSASAAKPPQMADAAKPVPAPKQPLGRQAANVISSLGQPIWRPSDAAGFSDKSDHWFSASQMSQRIQWVRRLTNQVGGATEDPRQFVKLVLADYARDDTIRVVTQAPNRKSGLMMTLVSPEFNRR
ncbi:DUF1800 domain-containing protein [Rhizobium oryziradicis]|uniref:DUF1800 domain-containing protein n=1 Tax=Rhizobium oryziradicis TaxID=1867956 RepID=A0A1Q8ZQ23_9HYPH|nr:DUF1800 domain-containing protein [Rhizobium oryziradicis]OLP43827.1 hypothetical protein BJF95_22455 [Rhizobium oryziradicis]